VRSGLLAQRGEARELGAVETVVVQARLVEFLNDV
jgi:hypothetical protein